MNLPVPRAAPRKKGAYALSPETKKQLDYWASNTIDYGVRHLSKHAKSLANKGIDVIEEAIPILSATGLAALASVSGNPEFAPLAFEAGRRAGVEGAKALGGYAHGKVKEFEFEPFKHQKAMPPI